MKNKKGSTQIMENGSVLGQGISGIAVQFNKRPVVSRFDKDTPTKHGHSPIVVHRGTKCSKSQKTSPEKPLGSSQRKLILHFDVRNTVLVADSVTSIGVEQALNSYLTGVTWGYEKDGSWQWVSDKPSLTAPTDNCMTYYKHLEKKLVRTPTDRGALRQHTGDFTDEPLGQAFRSYFVKALKELEWSHKKASSHNDADSILTMTGKDGKLYHYILPAVFQLIQHLHDTNRDFAIIVRTYGMDAPNVLKAIDHSLQGNHVDFPNLPSIKVNLEPGHIQRPEKGLINMQIKQDGTEHYLTDEKEMYHFLSQQTGVQAFVDDFLFWQNNSYSSECGKPFWLDTHDHSVQHIIFDDNIRLTDADSIVDLRVLRHSDHGQSYFSSVLLQNTAKHEDMCLVQADLLESTENINYFVEKVNACEKKYTQFLQKVSQG